MPSPRQWLLRALFGGVAARMIGLYLRCSRPIVRWSCPAVCGVPVDLPRPEDSLAELKTLFAEFFLCAQALRVRSEVALQMSPAQLATRERQMR